MNKVAGKVVAVLLAVALSAGCGVREERPETEKSGMTEKDRKDRTECLAEWTLGNGDGIYVTEHCIYRTEEGEEKSELVQSDWQGEEQHRYPLGESIHIQGISEKYVCYSDGDENSQILYLAPMEETEHGEEVQFKKKEEIARAEWDFSVYAWKSKVYYIQTTEVGFDYLYCYDAKKKERTCLLKSDQNSTLQFCNRDYGCEYTGNRIVHDGKIYFIDVKEEDSSFYCVDRETAQLSFLGEWKDCHWERVLAVKDGFIFCSVEDADGDNFTTGYIVYDTEEKRKKAELTQGQLKTFLKQQGLWKKGAYFEMTDARDGREGLDLVIELYWPGKITATGGPQQGKEIKVSKRRPILLHCPWQELTSLSLDQDFSQWMDEHLDYADTYITVPPTADICSHYSLVPNVSVRGFYGDDLLICCREFERKDAVEEEAPEDDWLYNLETTNLQLREYHLDSGKVQDVPKTDVLYQVIAMEF